MKVLNYEGLQLYHELASEEFANAAEIQTALTNLDNEKVDKDGSKVLSTNDYTTAEKNKLAGIAAGAEVNQNAFSSVTVGSTTISADSKTDTLTFTAGSNITLTLDATNDKVTISATDTTYGAAGSSLGLVKSGGDVTISSGLITVKDDSHSHSNYVTNTTFETLEDRVDAIGKVVDIAAEDPDDDTIDRISEIIGYIEDNEDAISIITNKQDKNLGSGSASKVLVTDTSGNITASSNITTTELGYLNGATSNLQTQITTAKNTADAKLAAADITVTVTGTGNAITAASYDDEGTITLTKGATFNNYSLPTASSTLGGVKTTSTVTSTSGYTPVPIIGGVPYYKDTKVSVDSTLSSSSTNPVQNKVINSALSGKQDTITLTKNRALISDSNGKVAVSGVTNTELGYLDGVTSNIQTQFTNLQNSIDSKQNSYPTSFTWTDGINAGPVGKINGVGMSEVVSSAIPYATSSHSGVVTCNEQTFSGEKSFLDKVEADRIVFDHCSWPKIVGTLTPGWYRIAKITGFYGGYFNTLLFTTGTYSSNKPAHGVFLLTNISNEPNIVQLGGTSGRSFTKIRLTGSEGHYYLDIYCPLTHGSTTETKGESLFRFAGSVTIEEKIGSVTPLSSNEPDGTQTSEINITTIKNSVNFKISDYFDENSSDNILFDRSADMNLKLPSDISLDTLRIKNDSGVGHIVFDRNGYNYLHATGGEEAAIALCANSTLGRDASTLIIDKNSARPGTNNTYSLGTESSKWSNVYATTFTGSLSGKANSAAEADFSKFVKNIFDVETSRVRNVYIGYKPDGETVQGLIAHHNTGGENSTGAFILIPHPPKGTSYATDDGLYVSKNLLRLDGNRVPTTGNTSGTLGGTYQPIYSNAGVLTAGTSYAKAIKNITRNGVTFTYTCVDGTTNTFNQQDTDEKVKQSSTSTSNMRPLILGYTNLAEGEDLTGAQTNQVYVNNYFYAKPSTGTLYTKNMVLTSESSEPHLTFSRGGSTFNYIKVPNTSYLGFSFPEDNAAVGISSSSLIVNKSSVYPGTTGAINLGLSDYTWNNIWSSGTLTVKNITITNSATSHITFSGRTTSHNYLHVPGTGTIAICCNETLAINNCSLVVSPTSVAPGGTGQTVSLGTTSAKWGNLYAKDANFTGNLFAKAANFTGAVSIRDKNTTETTWKPYSNFRAVADGTVYLLQIGVNSSGGGSFNLYDASAQDTTINNMILGASSTSFKKPVTVGSGGTGASSKSGARTNLGISSGTSLPSSASEGDIFFLY